MYTCIYMVRNHNKLVCICIEWNYYIIFAFNRHSVSRQYFVVLAFWDSTTLTLSLTEIWFLGYTGSRIADSSNSFCHVYTFLQYYLSSNSIWTVVLVAVDRFIGVKWPMRYKDICTKWRAYTAMIVCNIILAIIYTPNIFIFGQGWFELLETTGEKRIYVKYIFCTHVRSNYNLKFYRLFVLPWIDIFVFSLIPFSIIAACNIFIGRYSLVYWQNT